MTGALLQDYLRDSAERRGDAAALVMGEERLSFGELDMVSNRVVRLLLDAGCLPGDRICIIAPKAPLTIAAMLAVLKAGCVYVPVDVAGPVKRTARVLQATEPAAVIVLGGGIEMLGVLDELSVLPANLAVIGLDAQPAPRTRFGPVYGPADTARAAAHPLPVATKRTHPDGAAHILFTSGSTGQPKGVVVTHASVAAFVDWAVGYFQITAGERLSQHPPLHFDLSTFDIYAALKSGAELHLVPPQTLLPRQLAEFIAGDQLDQFFCVPSAMSYLSSYGALPDGGFPSLKRVLWCGEVLPTPVLIEWMRRVPQARFTNLYGPTEAAIASSYYTVPNVPEDERQPTPIGVACACEELLIIDADGRSAPDGETGELCIAGVGLSPGYWRDPATTAIAFVEDPRPGRAGERIYRTGDLARFGSDRLFHFLGRGDTQIKSRGYRIELGEIEAAISALPDIAECAVVGVETDRFEGTSICCALALRDKREIMPAQLRTGLSDSLPAYMIPVRWKVMSVLPKNVNGKIDRRVVKESFAAGVASYEDAK